MLQQDKITRIEDLLVEDHDIFGRHCFDTNMHDEFKVKLPPKDDSPSNSQILPTPINLKEDILVELAHLHRYGIITTLPFSKYAIPIFAQKKPNSNLRLLVDLKKIKNLISVDYVYNNRPVSTLSDAAQHMTGKNSFANWTVRRLITVCRGHQRSIEKRAFNLTSRIALVVPFYLFLASYVNF